MIAKNSILNLSEIFKKRRKAGSRHVQNSQLFSVHTVIGGRMLFKIFENIERRVQEKRGILYTSCSTTISFLEHVASSLHRFDSHTPSTLTRFSIRMLMYAFSIRGEREAGSRHET
jgi:hypothetical protein